MSCVSAQRGFTLIEVLLAVSITVTVAVMSYQGLDAAIKLSERSQIEADRIQQLNRVFDILGKDFRQVVARKIRSPDASGFKDAFFYQASAMPMLGFTRNGWTNPQPERFQRSQLQRVNYSFEDEKLIRHSWQMVDRFDDSEVTSIVLLDHVESINIKLLSDLIIPGQFNNTTTNATKTNWVDKWPNTSAAQVNNEQSASIILPLAIEITLQVEGWGEITRLFEMVDTEFQL